MGVATYYDSIFFCNSLVFVFSRVMVAYALIALHLILVEVCKMAEIGHNQGTMHNAPCKMPKGH